MNTLQELWAIFVALWNTGNRIARAAILLIVLWPILICGVALIGSPAVTSIAALIPVVAIAFSIIAAIDPIIIAVVAAFKKGRTVLAWIATIIAAELVLGVYFSIVPVWNDRGLVPVVVLVAVAIFFLAIGTKGRIQKTAISAMALIAIILTIIFFLGGRDKAAGKFESKPLKITNAGASVAAISPIEEFYLQVGKEIQTVVVSSGTHHRLESDKPFIALSWDSVVGIKEYEMPTGVSYWNGTGSIGRLGLKGIQPDTLIRITKI